MPSYVDKKMASAAGRRIAEARRARGLTLRALGSEVGVDYSYLRRIEQGQNASATMYSRIASALRLDLGSMLAPPTARTRRLTPSRV